jgi:hypothetical protein
MKPQITYFVDEEYFVTALVPSDTACLASSPGRISRTLYVVSFAYNTYCILTMFESLATRLWTSYCMQQA